MQNSKRFTRRDVLKAGVLGVGLGVAGPLLAACGAPAPSTATPAATAAPAPAKTAAPAAAKTAAPPQPTAPPAKASTKTTWASKPIVHGSCCEPNTIDPAAVSGAATDGLIVNAAYEGLTRYTTKGEIEPALATSWKISDDSLTYVFKLREGVKFHDGSDFNAGAVKVSFERMKAMKLGVSLLLDSVGEVKVVDPTTVQVTLSKPDAQFWFGVPSIKIVSPKALEANRKSGDWAQDFFRENTVGTGPYRMERWDRGRQVEMVAFDGYWKGWEGKHIQKYIIRFGMDMASRLLAMEKGEIHIIDWAGLSEVRRMANNPKIVIRAGQANWSSFYQWMNTQSGPLKDRRVRQAMMLAFPYKDMLEVMGGYATPMTSPVPDYMVGYCKSFEAKQDLDKARALLAEAGYANGFTIRQPYKSDNEVRRLAAQLYQEALAKLNVKVVLEDITWAKFLQSQSKLETAYDTVSAGSGSPVPYAGTMLYNLGHSSVQGTAGNYSFYANPKFDSLVEQAIRLSPSDPKANDLLCQAQKMLIDDAVLIPVMSNQYIELRRAELKAPEFDSYAYPYDVHPYEMYLEG